MVQGWNDGSEDYNVIHRLRKDLAVYEDFVAYVRSKKPQAMHPEDEACLASMGLGGESGELIDIVKKHVFHKTPLDREKLLDEAGDVLHYLTWLLDLYGFSLSAAISANRKKLDARYPGGWVEGGGIRE